MEEEKKMGLNYHRIRDERKLTGTGDNDGDDKSVDTEDTSHDNGNDWLDDELGFEDSDGADTDARFGSAVSGTHVAEDESADDSHAAEEKSLVGITVHYTNWDRVSDQQSDAENKTVVIWISLIAAMFVSVIASRLTEDRVSSGHI